jgi:hypothetical protein
LGGSPVIRFFQNMNRSSLRLIPDMKRAEDPPRLVGLACQELVN